MANAVQVLDKIERNMKQRGYSDAVIVRGNSSLSVTKVGGHVLVVSYVPKAVQLPMGGIDSSINPFLGIGVGAPGSIKIKGDAAESTLGAIFSEVTAMDLMMECSGFANDVIIESGASTAQLARLRGSVESIGLGA